MPRDRGVVIIWCMAANILDRAFESNKGILSGDLACSSSWSGLPGRLRSVAALRDLVLFSELLAFRDLLRTSEPAAPSPATKAPTRRRSPMSCKRRAVIEFESVPYCWSFRAT